MPTSQLLNRLRGTSFSPRSLLITHPQSLIASLSLNSRAFFNLTLGDTSNMTVLDITSDKWREDSLATDFFWKSSKDQRTEILALIASLIHEYTHRIDFLISPFGLHYYGKLILEYTTMQLFMPIAIDNPQAMEEIRYLVNFDNKEVTSDQLKELWDSRLRIISHAFFAWGDLNPNRLYLVDGVIDGWGQGIKGLSDAFKTGTEVEPITVLDHFHTFRIPSVDRIWYMKPLAIFETKAVVNSLLFITHLFGEGCMVECQNLYEAVYLDTNDSSVLDYRALLDLAAGIYDFKDFGQLLRSGRYPALKSCLVTLSSICWYALQAPPLLRVMDPRAVNPILRFWIAFIVFRSYTRREFEINARCGADVLRFIDSTDLRKNLNQLTDDEINAICIEYHGGIKKECKERIWNPNMSKHFAHILDLMEPHIMNRFPGYTSYLGMPDCGNPLLECRTPADWELTYDDYQAPTDANEWFSMRHELFFGLTPGGRELTEKLNEHFKAFFIPHYCTCGAITGHWVSRWFTAAKMKCGACGTEKEIPREDFTVIQT